MAGIGSNQGQLRLALITICSQLDQGDGTFIPVTVADLAEMLAISHNNASAIMGRRAKDGMVQLTRGRWEPQPAAYENDLVGGVL